MVGGLAEKERFDGIRCKMGVETGFVDVVDVGFSLFSFSEGATKQSEKEV